MGNIIIEGKKYHGLVCSDKKFNNYTFIDCTFEDCDFFHCSINDSSFAKCVFINCHFEYGAVGKSKFLSCSFSSCLFFDSPVGGNEVLNCQCSGLKFTNNTQVTNNIFDGLTGNIESCDCVGAFDNTFKNMDFSGFIASYYKVHFDAADWPRNRFINTTISLDAIMQLAKKAKIFGFPHFRRKGFISPHNGLSVMIDMHGLSDEAKFVLVANAILRLPNIEETNIVSNVLEGTLSCDLHLSAVDNEAAPTILDEDGRILKPCAIPILDVKRHFSRTIKGIHDTQFLVQVDDDEYGINLSDRRNYEHTTKRMLKENSENK